MERPLPDGWKVVDKYAMTRGKLTISRTYHNGVMVWSLYDGPGPVVYSGRDDEGAYAEAVMIAQALEEVAA